jgi:hypothetical protein
MAYMATSLGAHNNIYFNAVYRSSNLEKIFRRNKKDSGVRDE